MKEQQKKKNTDTFLSPLNTNKNVKKKTLSTKRTLPGLSHIVAVLHALDVATLPAREAFNEWKLDVIDRYEMRFFF